MIQANRPSEDCQTSWKVSKIPLKFLHNFMEIDQCLANLSSESVSVLGPGEVESKLNAKQIWKFKFLIDSPKNTIKSFPRRKEECFAWKNSRIFSPILTPIWKLESLQSIVDPIRSETQFSSLENWNFIFQSNVADLIKQLLYRAGCQVSLVSRRSCWNNNNSLKFFIKNCCRKI